MWVTGLTKWIQCYEWVGGSRNIKRLPFPSAFPQIEFQWDKTNLLWNLKSASKQKTKTRLPKVLIS